MIGIRHEEIDRPVWWTVPSGAERLAIASFVVALDGNALVSLRLIRVKLGDTSMGRADALLFEQSVERWEAEAASVFRFGLPATATQASPCPIRAMGDAA